MDNDNANGSEAANQVGRSQQCPEPYVVDALEDHKTTVVILHGRGPNAKTFGPALLNTRLPPHNRTFQQTLPNTKFVFPIASFKRAKVFKRIPITQWFDLYSVDNPLLRSELQIEGLVESTGFIHSLLRKEIELVGAEDVVLGGFSQGCAAMLICLLLWSEPMPIRAAFGMSGWLPFEHLLVHNLSSKSVDEDDDDDLFDRHATEDHDGLKETNNTPLQNAIRSLSEELGVPAHKSTAMLSTPLFLGHGALDVIVDVKLGKKACHALSSLGCSVAWHEYEEIGHWYDGQELADIVEFIGLMNTKGLVS